MKLCLGTVQFGMDYGVFEQPKKEPEYCIKCLDYATQNGIDAIDTATAYGIAESVVGSFLKKKTVPREKLFISTKLRPNCLDDVEPERYRDIILENIKESLKTLNTEYVDAYLLHSSRYAFDPIILDALTVVKKEGMARNIGVSVYYPDEAEACIENANVEYMQMPYSIFDHRMKENEVFTNSQKKNIHVDVRTTFIKGLIRLRDDEIPEHLSKARPILKKLDEICSKTGFTRVELAMGYVKREKEIDHLVFGIRTLEQLQQDIAAFKKVIPENIFEEMDSAFADIPTDLVVPSLWVKK